MSFVGKINCKATNENPSDQKPRVRIKLQWTLDIMYSTSPDSFQAILTNMCIM